LKVWRISKAKYATQAFTDIGAKLTGGGWNYAGEAVVYTSVSLALAALETYVHLPSPLILPKNLVAVAAEIPDMLAREIITVAELPADWQNAPPPDALKQLGIDWLQREQAVFLIVPFSIIPDETNLLLNPVHADFAQVQIGKPQPFVYDLRMKK
jgi:RES domain-containing protein